MKALALIKSANDANLADSLLLTYCLGSHITLLPLMWMGSLLAHHLWQVASVNQGNTQLPFSLLPRENSTGNYYATCAGDKLFRALLFVQQ